MKRLIFISIVVIGVIVNLAFITYRGFNYKRIEDKKNMISSSINEITGGEIETQKVLATYSLQSPDIFKIPFRDDITILYSLQDLLSKKSRRPPYFLKEILNDQTHFPQNSWFFIILMKNEERDKSKVLDIVEKYGFQKQDVSNFDLYWRYFEKGLLINQINKSG